MKKFIVAVVLLAVLVPALCWPGVAATKSRPGAIAAVGSGVVTQAAVRRRSGSRPRRSTSHGRRARVPQGRAPPQYNQIKASIVNYLVQNEVIRQQGRRSAASR